MTVTHRYVRYLFYKARPEWFAGAAGARSEACAELECVLEPYVNCVPVLRAFNTSGTRGGQEGRSTRIRPTGRKYLFVYPMVKKRAWYRLSYAERQQAMGEHIRIGHEFPRVKINTSYSFGLDDREFVVAFETDYPADFLDLVERLRGGEASAYTERETPIFSYVAGSIAEVLESLG